MAIADAPGVVTISRIRIDGLFGDLTHEVEINRTERVTILHGVNGVGKTKLLEATWALCKGNYAKLAGIPFRELALNLSDGTTLRAERSRTLSRGRAPVNELLISRLNHPSKSPIKFPAKVPEIDGSLPSWVVPVGNGRFMDRRTRRVISGSMVTRLYGIPLPAFEGAQPIARPDPLVSLPNSVHLIETQRLFGIPAFEDEYENEDSDEGPSLTMTVHKVASELRANIARTQNEFFKKTQELDRTLTDRVLKTTMPPESLGEQLRLRLESLDEHRKRLENVGLLDQRAIGPSLPPTEAARLTGDRGVMIAVHTEDEESKFQVLDPLARRLESFLFGMNTKLAPSKRLLLDKELNLTAMRGSQPVGLDQLSSGEQHELVLFYELSFRIGAGTLVMIDEPELSLHPVWQQQFLADVSRMAEAGSFNLLLATHSPYIIGNRTDLCVELKGRQ